MHFDNVYCYAKPFASDRALTRREVFLLRVLKTRLEETLHHELDDEVFLGILDAAFRSNGSGPLPYGPQLGPQTSFANYFKQIGYPESYACSQARATCNFFVDSCGIFRGKRKTAKMYDRLILHIPHSGTEFPGISEDVAEAFVTNASDIIEWNTDELFSPDEPDERIIPAVFPYCRTFCDVERMIDDPLEKKNLGIFYQTIWGQDYGFFRKGNREILLDREKCYRLYQEHHRKMEELLSAAGETLLIDCHSFSSHPTPLCPDYDGKSEVDICIGYNEDRTRPSDMVIGTVEHHFRSQGYKVGINSPFSNSKTFNTPYKYHSLKIEVNKKLYMDEGTGQKKATFEKLKSEISSLYDKLLVKFRK